MVVLTSLSDGTKNVEADLPTPRTVLDEVGSAAYKFNDWFGSPRTTHFANCTDKVLWCHVDGVEREWPQRFLKGYNIAPQSYGFLRVGPHCYDKIVFGKTNQDIYINVYYENGNEYIRINSNIRRNANRSVLIDYTENGLLNVYDTKMGTIWTRETPKK